MSRRSPKKKLEGLSFDDLRRQVKAGHVEPLYAFLGEESYYHDHALRLLANTLDEGGRLFNYAVIAIGSETSPGRKASAWSLVETANMSPMMAERRIVVARDFDKIKEDETDLLLDYLKQPSPTTTLVFQAASLDQRRKLTAAIMKTCTLVVFDRLSEDKAKRWVEEFLRRRGFLIEPMALGHLIGLVGTNLMRLVNELEKLMSYAGGGTITDAMITELVPRAREHSSWELWDAVIERNRVRALRLMERLLDDGSEPLVILGALAGLYRRMLAAKELMTRKAPTDEVNRATGRFGRNAEVFNARVLRTSREEIVHGLRRIAQVDNAIKNSEATPRLQMQYLIAELTLPESARWSIFQF
ncbi:MAG TPA: DNA polymerase III subunit delta [Blastocatellia bacterium]|nr:DNA polymerase III subunit delta [Blastocatellia bacterium]